MKSTKFHSFFFLFVLFSLFSYSQKIYLEVIYKGDSIEFIEKLNVSKQVKPVYPSLHSIFGTILSKKNISNNQKKRIDPGLALKKDSVAANLKPKKMTKRTFDGKKYVVVKVNEPINTPILPTQNLPDVDNNRVLDQEVKKTDDSNVIVDNYIYDLAIDVDEMPAYEGCGELYAKQARMVCMKNQIFNEIFKHLYFPKSAYEKGVEGSIIFEYLIDKDGKALPYSVTLNDPIYKEMTFQAIKKWLKETKEHKNIPAKKAHKPVRFSDFVIFSLKFIKGETKQTTQKEYDPNSEDKNRVKLTPNNEKQK